MYSSWFPKRTPSAFSSGVTRLVNLNDLAATVVPAVLADRVRQLRLPALWAGRVGRCSRLPVRAAMPGLGARRLPLGDGHLFLLSGLCPAAPVLARPDRPEVEPCQARPARIDGTLLVAAVGHVQVGAALLAEPGAVGPAQRGGREGQHDRVPGQGVQRQ